MPTQIAVVATAVSLGLLVFAWFVRPRTTDVGGRALIAQLLAALAGPAAVFAAMVGAGKQLGFPPATFQDWMVAGAAGSTVAGLLAGGGVGRRFLAAGLAAGGAYAVFAKGTVPLHGTDWAGQVTTWVAGLTAVTVAAVLARLLASRNSSPARSVEGLLAFALASIAASPVLLEAGLSVGSIAAAALSGGAGLFGVALVLIARFGRTESALEGVPALARAAGVSQAASLCLLVAWGLLFTDDMPPVWVVCALVLAPLATLLPFGASLPAALVRLTLVALLSGVAPAWPVLAERFGEAPAEAPADDSPGDYYR